MICVQGTTLGLCTEQASSARELTPQKSEGCELLFTYASFLAPWWDKLRCAPVAHSSNTPMNTPIVGFAPFPSSLPHSLLVLLGVSPTGNTLSFRGPAKYYYLYQSCPDLFRRIHSLSPALLYIFLYLSRCSPSLQFLCIMSPFSALSAPGEKGKWGLARWVGNKWE